MTITLDDDTARWARSEAARWDTSVSGFVADLLRERKARDDRYERARRSYLALGPAEISAASPGYPSRDELHRR